MNTSSTLPKIGHQRDWVWRGWQTRYAFKRPQNVHNQQPPVLFLHGFGGSIDHWRKNFTVFGEEHTVYALDLVGFGASRKPQTEYKISLWVEQIHDFWQTFVGEPMIIVGNSIGSLVALVAAATYPEMAESLVMVSLFDPSAEQESVPKLLQPSLNFIKMALVPTLLLKSLFYVVRQPGVAKRWAKIAYANDTAVDPELMNIFLTPAQDKEAADAFPAILRGMISIYFAPNIRRFLPRMKLPMLLIWGHLDKIIPRSNIQTLVRLNPNIKFVEIQAAGHCAHDEAPTEVNTIIQEWLAGHQKSGLSSYSSMPVKLF
jgi:pimeloyl-ACP methyl ester carboxylesterase